MKSRFLLSGLLAAMPVMQAAASTEWTIDNIKYNVDTLYHATIGPGTTETELRVSGSDGVNKLFYTTVELSNQYVEMRAAKAGNAMRSLETVPQIAERYNKPGETYFAGVNADFFNPGYPHYPLGACVFNGSLTNYKAPEQYADIDDYYLCFDNNGVPTFARHVTFATAGSVKFPDATEYPHSVNVERGSNQLVLYTHQWQFANTRNGVTYDAGHTGTNEWGAEIALQPVGDRTMWGTECVLEVVSDPEFHIGNMAIPEGGYVLSGHGNAIDKITALKKGDRVATYIGFKADDKDFAAKEVIGGFPYLLYNGTVQYTPSYPGHLSNLEPRSAVGYNADKTKLIMLVVDGRGAGGSAGVTQNKLARFIKNLGCAYAMNFDGGGSSTMYIDRLSVRNVPSTSSIDKDRPEGQPRTVVNALFAVSTAPVDNEIASIEIREKRLDLATGETYTPTVYGYNQYGALIDADLSGFTCKIAPELGTLSGTTFTASSGKYKGDLTVTYGSATYSIPVYVNGGGEYVNSGISSIITDPANNAPVEYYNIMGQPIDAPIPGTIVIRRQGSEVTKIVVK